MQAGKMQDTEQLMSLLREYEASGRDPAADGIPQELQVSIASAVVPTHAPAIDPCHVTAQCDVMSLLCPDLQEMMRELTSSSDGSKTDVTEEIIPQPGCSAPPPPLMHKHECCVIF